MEIRQLNVEPGVCDLSGALARMGGDIELLQKIAEYFREDSPEYLSRLRAAMRTGDSAGVQHAAHSLNGMVSNFGAEAASQAAERLEKMGSTGDLSSVTEAMRELEDEIVRLLASLARELTGR